MKNKSALGRRKVALLLSCASLVMGANNAYAGGLLNSYNTMVSQDYQSEVASALNSLSLEEKVKAKRSKLRPSLILSAAEVRRRQDITTSGNSLIRSGDATFDNSRRMATLKQPLFDPQLRGELALAKLEYKGSLDLSEQDQQLQITDYFVNYVEASMLDRVGDSYRRALSSLEKEQAIAEEKRELKIVTVHELDTIKLHTLRLAKFSRLSQSRYDRTVNYLESFNLSDHGVELGSMNQDLDSIDKFKLSINSSENISDIEVNKISNQISRLDQTIKNIKSHRWPTINAVGLYEFDDAAETIFGGENRVSNYEVGITLEWTLFSGGGSKHKMREAKLAKRSQEAILKKRNRDNRVRLATLQNEYTQSFQLMQDERAIMSHRKSVKEAIDKGHRAGTESLLAKIDSILLHEESVREYEIARHNTLTSFIKLKSFTEGISAQDARQIDALFN